MAQSACSLTARWAVAIAPFLLSACASIVDGQNQTVSVQTPGCDAARCELSNDKGKWFVPSTPGSVTIGRSYNNLQVRCGKDDFSAELASIASTTKGMAFGNILLGGIIGAGVDMHSGAAYDYPQLISVPMQCQPGSASPPGARPPRLGLQVSRTDPSGAGGAGVTVLQVTPGSPAAHAGLRAGDVILRIHGVVVSDPEDLAREIERLRTERVLELQVRQANGEATRQIDLSPQRDL